MQSYNIPSSFNESIYFDYAPVPTFAGHLNRHPFRVVITSSNDKPHLITLDSKYSKSYKPQKNKSKWSFLRPEVKFLDLNGNEIDEIITTDTKMYRDDKGVLNCVSGIFMGVSGYSEFYFVDDVYNYDLAINRKKYSTILAILQTSGIDYFDSNVSEHVLNTNYTNSKAIAYQPHMFFYRNPDYIKISENGIRDFINPRFTPINQYVVFTFNWNENYGISITDGNGIIPYNTKSNFNKSIPSNLIQNDVYIETFTNSIKTYYDKPITLSYLNNERYLSPGYCKTFFNVATSSNNVILSATSTFKTPDFLGNYHQCKLWLSNPNAGLMSLVEYNAPSVFNLSATFLQKANVYNFEVPIVDVPNHRKNKDLQYEDMFNATGYHNINSIAVLPYPQSQAWAIDGELNYLYKINTDGNILSAIDLLKIYKQNIGFFPNPIINDQLSPNSIVLDGEYNLWITLYDNKYVLNLDSNANFVYALDLTSHLEETLPPNINDNWYKSNQSYPYDEDTIEEFVEPTFLDIDSKNKIWVSYSNYTSGYLVKFDKNNNNLKTITYSVCSCPQDIIIDKHDNVWVSLANNIWRSFGSIEKRDTYGNLLSSFKSIMGVNELTLDLDQNLWFSYSYSRIGCIDNITGNITTFNILDNTDKAIYAQKNLTIPNTNTDETAIEGIACDAKGYLYVINSVENQVYVYDTKEKKYIDRFYVTPKGYTFWNPKGISLGLNGEYKDETLIEYNEWNKSLQAHGDWTGMRWINKFINNKTDTITISGQSAPLRFLKTQSVNSKAGFSFLASTFYKYINTDKLQDIKVIPENNSERYKDFHNIDLFKINENYDLSSQMKSLAFTPALYGKDILFDKFLPSIYGTFPYQHDDLGVFSYEKISNFVINNSDIDTCEVKNIYNLSNFLNADVVDNYMLDYPKEIGRLMDLLSISPNRLFGSVNKNQNYFKRPDENGNYNKGSVLNSTDIIIAGTPVVLKTKSLNKYEVIQTGPINEEYTYYVRDLAYFIGIYNDGDWQKYYEFYEFIPTQSNTHKDNVLDWDNPQTTFFNNITSNFEWMGDEQYIDTIFAHKLYTGLGIF